MKSRKEIEEKIRQWDEELVNETSGEETGWIYGIIDALLWVIGDDSGKRI